MTQCRTIPITPDFRMTSISVDAVSTPGGVATILQRLSAGEEIPFHDRDLLGRDQATFSLQKQGGTYITRNHQGRVLSSMPSFAEAWRSRPLAIETSERR